MEKYLHIVYCSPRMGILRVLAIETSCDETSVALLTVSGSNFRLTHHETATQIPIHARYGGVVPEIAARTHVAEIISLLERAKVFSKKSPAKFDAIAVTRGPGLSTALRVGIEAGRTIAFATGKPIVGVNHLEGHLASAYLVPENRKRWKFPILALLISGGHTELVLMKDFGKYRVIGRTRDDAAGEAFDKSAKLMGLGYPGGPIISELAATAQRAQPPFGSMKLEARRFILPRPMLNDASLDMSFSGLKTAVRQTWSALSDKEQKDKKIIAEMCAEIQDAICDVVIAKTLRAVNAHKPTAVCVVGGVSANINLQIKLNEALKADASKVHFLKPAKGLHTDNAAMIAAAAAWRILHGKIDNWKNLDAKPEWDL